MNGALLEIPPKIPEWPRIGKFIAIALGLHAAALLYPLTRLARQVAIPPPATVMVRLADPVALPEPVPAIPEPELAPQSQPKPKPVPVAKPRARVPRPVLAAPAVPVAPAPDFTVPAVAEPEARVTADVAPAPVHVTAARFDAAYLQNPRPAYPPLSRRLGEQGKVLLRIRVSPQGQAAAVDLEKSSNFQRLDEAARQVVARWRFVPARRGDEAVEATVIVPIVFRLEG
ncbi:MAG: TonB family protein [Azonexus sp.]